MKTTDKYTRVTTVLERYSGLSKVPEHILKRAAERGEIIHRACDARIEGIGEETIDRSYQGYMESFDQWYKDKNFISKLPRLYCDKLLLTGEVDQIYIDGNDLVLVDFKTPQKESKTWPLQGSAYKYLCRENGYNISRIEFVQLSRDGHYPVVHHYDDKFDLFLNCLNLYRYFNEESEEDFIQYI